MAFVMNRLLDYGVINNIVIRLKRVGSVQVLKKHTRLLDDREAENIAFVDIDFFS